MNKQDITILVLSVIDHYADSGSDVTPESYFYDLGIDSIDRAEIFLSIESQLGIDFTTRHDPSKIETISQLINLIYTEMNPDK